LTLDLNYDDAQQSIREALNQFCADRCDVQVVKSLYGRFPRELWRELCDLGVLEAAAPEGEGGALELAAAMEALGRWVVPGPWIASVLATQVLDAQDRMAVVSGEALVSAGVPPLWPWAPHASIFLELEGERIWRVRVLGEIEPVETLGGETWGRCEVERISELAGSERAHALGDLAHAAYVAAAGEHLLEVAAEHARTRTQFGRAIGEFQAVAHPLADCSIALAGAATLARAAAWRLDTRSLEEARYFSAAARLSANRAGLETAYACHQVFGAVGITLEGPAYHFTRRIRQLASLPGVDAAARERVLDHFQMPAPASGAARGAP